MAENYRKIMTYRITFAASLVVLVLAGWMFQTAYEQHIKILRIGDKAGELLQMRGLPTASPEGLQHVQR